MERWDKRLNLNNRTRRWEIGSKCTVKKVDAGEKFSKPLGETRLVSPNSQNRAKCEIKERGDLKCRKVQGNCAGGGGERYASKIRKAAAVRISGARLSEKPRRERGGGGVLRGEKGEEPETRREFRLHTIWI